MNNRFFANPSVSPVDPAAGVGDAIKNLRETLQTNSAQRQEALLNRFNTEHKNQELALEERTRLDNFAQEQEANAIQSRIAAVSEKQLKMEQEANEEAKKNKENATAAQKALDDLVINLSYDDDNNNSTLREALPEEIQNAGNEMTARLTKQQALASSYFQSGTQADLNEYLFMFREDLERAGIPEKQRDIDAAKQAHIMTTLYTNGNSAGKQDEFINIYKTRIDNVNKGLAQMLTVGELARALYKKDKIYREHIENIGGLDKFIEHLETISPDTTHNTIEDLRSQMSSVLSGQQESHQQNINNIIALANALDASGATAGSGGKNLNLAEAVEKTYGLEFLEDEDKLEVSQGLDQFRDDAKYKNIPSAYFLIAASTKMEDGNISDDVYNNKKHYGEIATLAENLYDKGRSNKSNKSIIDRIHVDSLLKPPTPAYGDINEFRLDKIRINPSSNNDFFNTLTFEEKQEYLEELEKARQAAIASAQAQQATPQNPPPQTPAPNLFTPDPGIIYGP